MTGWQRIETRVGLAEFCFARSSVGVDLGCLSLATPMPISEKQNYFRLLAGFEPFSATLSRLMST